MTQGLQVRKFLILLFLLITAPIWGPFALLPLAAAVIFVRLITAITIISTIFLVFIPVEKFC